MGRGLAGVIFTGWRIVHITLHAEPRELGYHVYFQLQV